MRRHAIGIIGLLLLIGAVVFWIWPPEGAWSQQAKAACWRLGPVMVVLWLAYTDVKRLPPWILGTFPVLLVVLVVRPRLLVIAIPLVVALAILKPRIPSRRKE